MYSKSRHNLTLKLDIYNDIVNEIFGNFKPEMDFYLITSPRPFTSSETN